MSSPINTSWSGLPQGFGTQSASLSAEQAQQPRDSHAALADQDWFSESSLGQGGPIVASQASAAAGNTSLDQIVHNIVSRLI